jgi:CRISPR-associated protein Csx10
VAINRRRGTAEDRRLYSPLVINEVTRDGDHLAPTRFVGSVAFPSDNREALCTALKAIERLGGRQTTGLGAVTITETKQSPETHSAIKQRVANLTGLFQQQAERYEKLEGKPWTITHDSIFTINLLSDAILLEHGWVPTQQLSATMLRDITGIEATLLRAFASTRTVGGWNVSWQRPKPTSLATTMGSVFVFQANEKLTDEHYTRLARLQLDGIGERRAEGYGQVRICDEFHLQGATAEKEQK